MNLDSTSRQVLECFRGRDWVQLSLMSPPTKRIVDSLVTGGFLNKLESYDSVYTITQCGINELNKAVLA